MFETRFIDQSFCSTEPTHVLRLAISATSGSGKYCFTASKLESETPSRYSRVSTRDADAWRYTFGHVTMFESPAPSR